MIETAISIIFFSVWTQWFRQCEKELRCSWLCFGIAWHNDRNQLLFTPMQSHAAAAQRQKWYIFLNGFSFDDSDDVYYIESILGNFQTYKHEATINCYRKNLLITKCFLLYPNSKYLFTKFVDRIWHFCTVHRYGADRYRQLAERVFKHVGLWSLACKCQYPNNKLAKIILILPLNQIK